MCPALALCWLCGPLYPCLPNSTVGYYSTSCLLILVGCVWAVRSGYSKQTGAPSCGSVLGAAPVASRIQPARSPALSCTAQVQGCAALPVVATCQRGLLYGVVCLCLASLPAPVLVVTLSLLAAKTELLLLLCVLCAVQPMQASALQHCSQYLCSARSIPASKRPDGGIGASMCVCVRACMRACLCLMVLGAMGA